MFHLRALLGISVIAAAGSASAQEGLRPVLNGLAKNIAVLVRNQRQTSVAFGPFQGRFVQESAGPGIRKILEEELVAEGVAVNRTSSLEVSVRYFPRGDARELGKSGEIVGMQITATITDVQGNVLVAARRRREEQSGKDR